ncbi:MAG TPA: DUF883 family protein [Candidatus Krumholzibacteria bacterium]|nr:DUF883 family protein [Candidatus Krumholzibacteria bacterium]
MSREMNEEGGYRASVDAVLEDLRAVVHDVDALLHATKDEAGDKFSDVRARVEESLNNAKERLHDAGEGARDRARSVGRNADTYVRENPWTTAAIALGIGYIVGRMGRRD